MRVSIVSYLDPETTKAVRDIQQTLSDLTGAKASLTTWLPHVTVGDGVEFDDAQEEGFLSRLKELTANHKPFNLELKGIGTLDNWQGGEGEVFTPYVIYLDVVINESLMNIVKGVSEASEGLHTWYKMPEPYLPHCTLAFRDLTKEGFEKGIAYLATQNLSFTTTIDHISLVEMLPTGDTEYVRLSLNSD